MIRFYTLGVLDLRGSDDREIRSVLRQPKRLGLLAYLTVASPRRFHRRDSLLALFWPELDQEHARAALRRSLYFLRAELGADALAGRGDDEVGAPEDILWCDATALEYALREGRVGQALTLYQGTLLEGLYVAGAAPEYQDWLDRQRTTLRNGAASAARNLMEQSEADGRTVDAARWCRRILDLNPDDETMVRRLLRLLDQTGDRSAALRAYDTFARRMAQEYELGPSPETQAVISLIRRRHETMSPTAAAPVGETDPGLAGSIAVLPFSVRGDARFGYLSEGMVDLLATKLDGAGEIRTVDPRALLRFVTGDSAGAARVDGTAVARHFGSSRFLVGSLVEAGGRIEAQASLYAADGQAIASVSAAAHDESGIFELVDELTRQLLAVQGVGPGSRWTRLAALTTGSLDALKAYLRGEQQLRNGRYFDAMEHFQAAVATDQSFALAYYRLSAAAAGCALPELAREVADRGFAHRERLSAHDGLVFSAQRAWLHGITDEAESLFNTIIGSYPDEVEAWFHLGDLLFHSNPLRGRSARESRAPLERVLQLDPGHVSAMVHLVRVAALDGNRQEMLDRIETLLRVSPQGDQSLAMRALRAYTEADRVAIVRVTEELQAARAITVAIAFSDVALYSGDLSGAESLARSFIQVARSPELRALCHGLVAHLALAQGEHQSAMRQLHQAEDLHPVWGLELRGLFAGLPFVNWAEEEVLEVRRALNQWDAAGAKPSTFFVFGMHNDRHVGLRAYLLGLLDLKLGDTRAATTQADALEQLRSPPGGLLESLQLELRAAVARAEGRPGEGLKVLEQSQPQLWFQLTVASPFFSLVSQRYLRAELLRETGRLAEAAGWYASLAERSPYELIYAASARQRLLAMQAASAVSR